ncbi:MAG: Crp/Fnr family transcriptional regulator [Hymenobacter sp.]|nr:MAG: Crp/Fnr family transcriptional regulator [Hymenobacter sp.]
MFAQENLILFLQSTGLISAQQAPEIAAYFAPKTLKKHAFLLREGQVCDEYLLLDSGLVRAFASDPDGHDVTTGLYTGGQLVFEVASFFNRVPSQENIQALTATTGWSITYQQLNELFHTRPEFREFGRSVLVKGLATLKSRMLAMITATAAERYVQLLHAQPQLVQQVPLKYLASYLGVTDTSLSRIRAGR